MVGNVVNGGGVKSATIVNTGALEESPSWASAVRCPDPLITKAIALPLTHPPLFTISCTIAVRLGVC